MSRNVSLASSDRELVCSAPIRCRRPESARLTVHAEADGLVVEGELDAYGAGVVAASCREWIEARHDPVRIDVSNVSLIDSAGTRLLEELRDIRPPSVRLVDPSPIVRRVFEVLGVVADGSLPMGAEVISRRRVRGCD